MIIKVKFQKSVKTIELLTDRLSVLCREDGDITRLPFPKAFLTHPTKKTFEKFCRELDCKFIEVVDETTEHHRWEDYKDGEFILNIRAKSEHLKMENSIRLQNQENALKRKANDT